MVTRNAIRIHADDDVAVVLASLDAGATVEVDGARVTLRASVPAGHKVALRALDAGEPVRKYGYAIGVTTTAVAAGDWIHSHNLRTGLTERSEYRYEPATPLSGGGRAAAQARIASWHVGTSSGYEAAAGDALSVPTFDGYRRANGRVGTRNEIWVLSTVGCVNHAAERIARLTADRLDGIDGVHTFVHPYGCSQLGDDLSNTQRVLAGLMRHPNAGGVLVLGLGCENNQMENLLRVAGDVDRDRLAFFNSQDVLDEIEEGVEAVTRLAARMQTDRRQTVSASELVTGHKCGGSDGFSGISANALVGRIADRLTELGGGVILTEVPEMFGAEQILMNRAVDERVYDAIVRMIDDFKQYFVRHDQPVYENPSPGNIQGGLTTLAEKSLGAIQKGGRAPVTHVLRYGERWSTPGLSLLEAPGNDGVSSTAMVASGATMLLFTTGRGTPLGFPAPTLKISSNTLIAEKKPHWIDFNAGALLDGSATLDSLEDDLFSLILDVASGRTKTNNETHGYREIAIWKEGVTL